MRPQQIEWGQIKEMIDSHAKAGGTLHSNLRKIEAASEAAQGRGTHGGYTERELAYVCAEYAAVTLFYGGGNPC
jgi:hypothetical protein